MILLKLLWFVRPMFGAMLLAITLGVLGHASAFLIPVLGVYLFQIDFKTSVLLILIFSGILRGFFRYGEQYLNHFIAFTILAQLRAAVFKKMRTLGERVDRGELVTLISSDIELLEVFFAHTVSPIVIALIFNSMILYVLYQLNPIFALIGLIAYLLIGVVIPFVFSHLGTETGQTYRDDVGDLNAYSLEGIQGIKEIVNYGLESSFLDTLKNKGEKLLDSQSHMKRLAGYNRALCDGIVLGSGVLVVYFGLQQAVSLNQLVFGFVIVISSFGPVLALSQLTNNLYLTRASAHRVLGLMDEEPKVKDLVSDSLIEFEGATFDCVSFAYDTTNVLNDFSLTLNKGQFIGIKGASGSGKSTLLKLLMRLHSVNEGSLLISGRDIESVDSMNLRSFESVMFQSTSIFNASVYNNILLARKDASEEDVIEAMRRAELDDFIEARHSLILNSMGTNISSGECQRIALARIFLHGGDFILLDEPSANLDALNESVLLHALKEYQGTKTIVMVSHRDSTLRFADIVYNMEDLLM